MTNRERVLAVLNGEKPDRLPVIEWAAWWDQTTLNWETQGIPRGLDRHELFAQFGLDNFYQISFDHRTRDCPKAKQHGHEVILDEKEYQDIKKYLYSKERIQETIDLAKSIKTRHDKGDIFTWFCLEGYFWYPRTLFGIQNHFTAFYDYPELMHQMNKDLLEISLYATEELFKVMTPEFMTIAEDMSYNHGPMCSKQIFDEFMAPYYRQIIPLIKEKGTKVFVDTDGFVEPIIPWFLEVGVEGVLPLERMASVDINRIRANYPTFLMIGGFDKTVMSKGEEAMRNEFERLLPVMKSGRYIPGVDHQTPPDVSVENYRIYVKLLKEYASKI